jgi:pilus assembly protein FimV
LEKRDLEQKALIAAGLERDAALKDLAALSTVVSEMQVKLQLLRDENYTMKSAGAGAGAAGAGAGAAGATGAAGAAGAGGAANISVNGATSAFTTSHRDSSSSRSNTAGAIGAIGAEISSGTFGQSNIDTGEKKTLVAAALLAPLRRALRRCRAPCPATTSTTTAGLLTAASSSASGTSGNKNSNSNSNSKGKISQTKGTKANQGAGGGGGRSHEVTIPLAEARTLLHRLEETLTCAWRERDDAEKGAQAERLASQAAQQVGC